MKKVLVFLHWIIVVQLGLDVIKFIKSIISLPKFLLHLIKFKKNYKSSVLIKPCLFDWYEEAGSYNHEYFWQDLYVSEFIIKNKPVKHLDIGSRIDGFILSLASSRQVEILDIREIKLNHHNIKCIEKDFINNIDDLVNYTDSLSCLHTLEHFGLGRYGDDIDVFAYKKAIKNLSLILKKEGFLYLSTPIGKEKVLFNANRVFDHKVLINDFANHNLKLIENYIIDKKSQFRLSSFDIDSNFNNDQLGIFIFQKIEK